MCARYRCPCGYEADDSPSAPVREIVSVYHIHRSHDARGGAILVRMEPVEAESEPAPREPAAGAAR